ncbi:cysteine rich repeat-containing protein [Sinorhizobium meliloti]|uniref:cysteine rich repeat-containing protein n=1 Tax=Rhizobium meliloti TaxID=382 RepID=UPI0020905515|nr:cysteine rich repeat-containing protein [Sinorhizobium meliloti]MCO5965073.1 cysteine rich repeat-containing protein [Sinorhizobium meliloti]
MKTYITVAFLVLAGVANAQQMSRQQMHEVRSACEADVERLCNGVQPGGGKLMQCLQQNASSLSETCTATLMELKAARESN